MHAFAHIMVNYFTLWIFIPNVREYLWPIVFFSVILDIDHIPGYIDMITATRKEKRFMKKRHYIGFVRTALQEPANFVILAAILIPLYLWLGRPTLVLVALACLGLHIVLDLLTVHTHPFYPFNHQGVLMFIPKTLRARFTLEAILTVVIAAAFAVAWFY